jgi:phospholipid transport system substrate-binding protein
VEVRSQVNMPRGEPIPLNYRVAKGPQGWKIYDINVLGAWLVETYKGTSLRKSRKAAWTA